MILYTNPYSYSAPYPHTYLETPASIGFIGLERDGLAASGSNENSALE